MGESRLMYAYAEPMVNNDILDVEISMNELVSVMNELKNGMAPGVD